MTITLRDALNEAQQQTAYGNLVAASDNPTIKTKIEDLFNASKTDNTRKVNAATGALTAALRTVGGLSALNTQQVCRYVFHVAKAGVDFATMLSIPPAQLNIRQSAERKR